jgi:hypothetical protein
MNRPVKLLRPERIRTVEKPFAWLPFRFLSDGHMAAISDRAKLLYLLLCLAADKYGLSFWGDKRIQDYFQLDTSELQLAKRELIEQDLIAYDGHLYQVLSLPKPSANAEQQLDIFSRPRTAAEPDKISDIIRRIAKAAR